MHDEEIYIRKSPVLLAIKIITAEMITELSYSIFHITIYDLGGRTEKELALLSGLLNIALSIVAVVLFIVIFAIWSAEGVLVGKKELVHKYGVIRGHRKSYPYTNMQRIEVQQSLLGRMFNFGTINVHLPILSEDIRFSDIPDPHNFAERLKLSIIQPDRQQYLVKR